MIVHNLASLAKLTKFWLICPGSIIGDKAADSNYSAVGDNLLPALPRYLRRVQDVPNFRTQHILEVMRTQYIIGDHGGMIKLDKSLHAWGTAGFESVLKREIAQLGADQLPLQQGLSGSSSVSDEPVSVVICSVAEMEKDIRIKAGIFYRGIAGGCSCADDPTSGNEINEYCEVLLDIDKYSAATRMELVTEAAD